MSSQVRNDRRRHPTQNSSRQEWIRRGSVIATVVNTTQPSAAPVVLNPSQASAPPASLDRISRSRSSSGGNVGDPSYRSTPRPDNRSSGQFATRSSKGRPLNQRRDRDRARERENRDSGRTETDRENGRVDTEEVKDASLPLLVQELQEKLAKGSVECMICYDMVRRSAPIWSCSSCYSIFHLNCIRKWARAPTSVDLIAEKNQGDNWRCPGCQSVQLTTPKEIRYECFCRKRVDPPSDLYLTPHSCGESCGKPFEKEAPVAGNSKDYLCPHVCVLQCHPGPCPPCKAFAPPCLCPCGKKMITTRCSDRRSVLTCGQRCDRLLDCWRHRCEKVCHVGPCDSCDSMIAASCFCKKRVEVLRCGEMTVKGEVKAEDGVFSCTASCGKKLGCGNHFCMEICHPGPCPECDLLPSRIKTCCCGKTNLLEQRDSCMDPVPTCQQVCGKQLPCGIHLCKEKCHLGNCAPCMTRVTQKCRCGSTSRTVECFKTTSAEEIFTCDKPCGRKKNCGRHRCSERCCPLSNSSSNHLVDWDPHFCSMVCGKKLRCGQHSCEAHCHSGYCAPCLETIFTDLTCACGRTSLPPPMPCGTPPPSCQLPCLVPQPCGHPCSHSCHFGDCPPCSVPVSKECVGSHVILRNIPCGSKDIRCNKLCGKTRQCGMHACARTCHPSSCDAPSGSGTSSRASCGQMCGAPRRDCRHTCIAPCHPSDSCPDVRCNFPVTITCSCGRITANVPCDAGGSTSGFSGDFLYEASILQKWPARLQPVESNGTKIPLGQRKLTCDDECAKLERKRVLADAFDITPPNLEALHLGENAALSELLSDLFRRDAKWVMSVEERCKFLVLGKSQGAASNMKVHVFCPMPKEKRDALRVIAERWKLAINTAGWEPKRFVVVHVTSRSKAPSRTLGVKGSVSSNILHPPVFDPLIDMDPRLVVSLLDLPRDADISALVLRFGGECELVWHNDKNALAVFHDPARAATAMRRLDHGSVYHGAVTIQSVGASPASSGANPWGVGPKSNPWKKATLEEPCWGEEKEENSWGGADGSSSSTAAGGAKSAWQKKEDPIPSSINRWSVLGSEVGHSSSVVSVSAKQNGMESHSKSMMPAGQLGGEPSGANASEAVDDWEKAYE
uniref:NF-X1-type zinc finger protein NFXL1 n=1 Tax=Kalanchoe fedtschenkoi TaxID=63787 RepID=A0A7N0VHK1_KALFE